MSTDLTTYEPAAQASAMILQTAQDLDNAFRIATAVCATSFAPAHFRGKPEEGAAAILYGATIDMDPLTALQQVHVISGKPALYARAMVAVVMSHGHEVWTEEETEGRCVVAGRRKGSKHLERVEWTTAMAERAGYTRNAKYQTDPRSMLYARASGDVARRIAPDALLGMAHNVEELSIDSAASVVEAAPRRRQASVDDFAAPAPAAAVIEGPAGEPEPATEPQAHSTHVHGEFPVAAPPDAESDEWAAISDEQVERVLVLAHELGITPQQLVPGLRHVTGREDVQAVRGLSDAEAVRVIASLEAKVVETQDRSGGGEVVEGELLEGEADQ